MGTGLVNFVVFFPPEESDIPFSDQLILIKHREKIVNLKTKNGIKIPAIYFPSKDGDSRTCVVYSHGNAGCLKTSLGFLEKVSKDFNVNAFSYEYIGYIRTENGKSPSEKGCYESIEAALEYLVNVMGFDFTDIILHAFSIGSGPSIHMAKKYKNIKGFFILKKLNSIGLILCGPICSVLRLVDWDLFSYAGCLDMFNNYGKIEKIKCPVILFAGNNDQTIPYSDCKKLWKKIPPNLRCEKYFVTLNTSIHGKIMKLCFRKKNGNGKKYIKIFLEYCDEYMEVRIKKKEIQMQKDWEKGRKYYIQKGSKIFEPKHEKVNEWSIPKNFNLSEKIEIFEEKDLQSDEAISNYTNQTQSDETETSQSDETDITQSDETSQSYESNSETDISQSDEESYSQPTNKSDEDYLFKIIAEFICFLPTYLFRFGKVSVFGFKLCVFSLFLLSLISFFLPVVGFLNFIFILKQMEYVKKKIKFDISDDEKMSVEKVHKKLTIYFKVTFVIHIFLWGFAFLSGLVVFLFFWCEKNWKSIIENLI